MSSFIAYTIFGLFSGAAYAIAASGLVLTYTTTRVFNIAHGAFGMVLSFLFWDFSVRQGLPIWLSLILTLFVVAPAIGWFISRFVAKGLGDAPVSVSLVVTVGLLVGCIGFATQVYKPEARTVLPFFPETSFALGETNITAHQLITILTSIAVAGGLYAAAQQDPDRHRHAGLGRQPRSAQAVRRQAGAGRHALLDDRHLAGRARRHPARLDRRPGHLLADPAGHQRLRRGDARPAQEPAADLRRAPWASDC